MAFLRAVDHAAAPLQDMAVRGAPAIAISAALALAVDLVNNAGAAVSTAAEAASYIQQKLEYLVRAFIESGGVELCRRSNCPRLAPSRTQVTSRPTAVNLADAAAKLRQLSDRLAAEPGASKSSVLDGVVAACEAMLAEVGWGMHLLLSAAAPLLGSWHDPPAARQDVAHNKAIGAFGADAILEATRGVTAGRKLRVLTHCNTGSLATAAYGTALGVIRTLHERGLLEHAYCTETRPYNQGARLTAFELVYERIPSTLICDSAACYLMSQGKVDAVVVGADRVAGNGDTANKIGTYSLATVVRHGGDSALPCHSEHPGMEGAPAL